LGVSIGSFGPNFECCSPPSQLADGVGEASSFHMVSFLLKGTSR